MSAIALPTSFGPSVFDANTRSDRRGDIRADNTSTAQAPTAQRTATSAGASSEAIPTSGRASDTVTISPEAQAASTTAVQGSAETADTENNTANAPGEQQGEQSVADSSRPRGKDGEPLTDSEVDQVDQLQARDAEVRQHEQAHVAAGGPYVTGGPTYEYQEGPDGKRYAVGGSVSIDTSAEDTPEATITKAQTVRRAALAPAEPSAQDRRVAAKASQLEQEARAELAAQRQEEAQQRDDADEEEAAAILSEQQVSTDNTPADRVAPAGTAQQLEQAYTSVSAVPTTFRTTA